MSVQAAEGCCVSGKTHGHFGSLSVIDVGVSNPSCTYKANSSVQDLMYTHSNRQENSTTTNSVNCFMEKNSERASEKAKESEKVLAALKNR